MEKTLLFSENPHCLPTSSQIPLFRSTSPALAESKATSACCQAWASAERTRSACASGTRGSARLVNEISFNTVL